MYALWVVYQSLMNLMKNSVNKKIRNDIILVLVILALALGVYSLFRLCAKEGSVANITLDGEIYASLPLSEDTVLEIKSGDNGKYINTVTVKDGKVFVSYANCPDGICKEHRPIKNVGETIVCLPHKIVVTIAGEGSDGGVDVVS